MRINCPHCGKTVESPVDLAVGQRVQCPYCLVKFAYAGPALAATVVAECPKATREVPKKGNPKGVSSPTLDDAEAGGGFKRILTFVVWLAFIGAAVLCLPRLKKAVIRDVLPVVSPRIAASAGFEPVVFEDEPNPAQTDDSPVAGRQKRRAPAETAAPAKPAIVGAKLGFCDDPKTLGPGTFAKKFGDAGTLYAVGDRAYFRPAKTNDLWSVPAAGEAFDPAERVFGEARKAVEALELDVKRALFRVKVGRVDTRREGEAKYTRRVEWATVADVPYGSTVDRATFEKAVLVLQQQWAKQRAKALFPLDTKLLVTIQVYDGKKIYFNEATGKWLLPRYRASCEDKAEWDRVNGRQEEQQKLFREHRKQIRARRRQWYENHTQGEPLFNAMRQAEVSVEPHEGEVQAVVAASVAAPPEPVAAPVAAAAAGGEPVVEEPIRPLAEKRPAPVEKPVAEPEEDSDLVEYDDDF